MHTADTWICSRARGGGHVRQDCPQRVLPVLDPGLNTQQSTTR